VVLVDVLDLLLEDPAVRVVDVLDLVVLRARPRDLRRLVVDVHVTLGHVAARVRALRPVAHRVVGPARGEVQLPGPVVPDHRLHPAVVAPRAVVVGLGDVPLAVGVRQDLAVAVVRHALGDRDVRGPHRHRRVADLRDVAARIHRERRLVRQRIRVARHLRVVRGVRPALHDVGGVVGVPVRRLAAPLGHLEVGVPRIVHPVALGVDDLRAAEVPVVPELRVPVSGVRGPDVPVAVLPEVRRAGARVAPDALVPHRVHHRRRPRVRERPVVRLAAHVLAGDAVVPVVADLEPPLPDRALDPGQVVRQRRVDVRRVAELRDPAPREVVAGRTPDPDQLVLAVVLELHLAAAEVRDLLDATRAVVGDRVAAIEVVRDRRDLLLRPGEPDARVPSRHETELGHAALGAILIAARGLEGLLVAVRERHLPFHGVLVEHQRAREARGRGVRPLVRVVVVHVEQVDVPVQHVPVPLLLDLRERPLPVPPHRAVVRDPRPVGD
jgi:hypothetical protein